MPEKKSCENCLYRQESWRDGGFCYMFRECIANPCAQWHPIEVTISSKQIPALTTNQQLILATMVGLAYDG